MTDQTRPPNFGDDELVSASIDGETTADDEARLAADPHLQERRRELAAAAAFISAPVPPPDDVRREAAIHAALDAAGPVAPVVELAARRRARLAVVSAAAAVLLIAIGVARVLQTDDTTSTVALDAAATSTTTSGFATQRGTSGASVAPGYVGAFSTNDELVSAVQSTLSSRLSNAAAAPAQADAAESTAAGTEELVPFASCEATDPGAGPIVFDGSATLDGRTVRVIVQDAGPGARLLSVVDGTCAVVLRQLV